MDHCEVKVSEVDEPACLATIEHLGLTEVGEVLVVGKDLDRKGGAMEVVPPRLQGTDDGKEFTAIDVLVLLHRGK